MAIPVKGVRNQKSHPKNKEPAQHGKPNAQQERRREQERAVLHG